MAINFTCVRCDRKYSVADAMASRRVTCKACGQEFNVPGGTSAGPSRSMAFDDDDDDDDGPPITLAPPPRTVSPAAYMPPRADPDPPPRAIRRPAAPSRSRQGETPDWVPSAIKGVIALAVIAAAGGGAWYVVNHGVPSMSDIQNIGVSEKAKDAVALVKEYTDVCNEMADKLAMMHDAESAKAQAATMRALDMRISEVGKKLQILRTLNLAEEKHVKATVGADVRQALGRIKSEIQRITSQPNTGNSAILIRNMVQIDREIASFGEREGSLSGKTADVVAKKPITVEATGLENEAARAAFGEKLSQLAVGSGLRSSALPGGGGRYQVEVSDDAKTFSKQITFGNVTKVSGDTITVVATLTAEDIAAERDKIAARATEEARRKADEVRHKKEDEDRQKVAKEREAAEIAANTPPPLETKVDPSAGPIDKAIVDTRSRDRHIVQEALKRLAWGVPEGRKDEVARAVAPLLLVKDIWIASDAAKTLAALKSPEAVPTLIHVIGREMVGHDAIEALAAIRDPRAAKPLADRLETDPHFVKDALIAIGSAAEPAVLAKLSDPKPRVRSQALDILEKIGGKETLKTMLTLPADPDQGVRMSANSTMRAIADRVGPIPEMKASPFKKVR